MNQYKEGNNLINALKVYNNNGACKGISAKGSTCINTG